MKRKSVFYKGLTALVISSMLATTPAVSHLAYADVDVVGEGTTEEETDETETEASKKQEAETPKKQGSKDTEDGEKQDGEEENNHGTENGNEQNANGAEAQGSEDGNAQNSEDNEKQDEDAEEENKQGTEDGEQNSNNKDEIDSEEIEEQKSEDAAAEFEANIAKLKAYEEKLESITSEDAAAIQELLNAVSNYLGANEDKLTSEIEEFLYTFTEKFNEACIKLISNNSPSAETKSINDQISAGETEITVATNTTEDVVIESGKNITLTIAEGVTLTNAKDHTVTVQKGGTLTINGEGTIDNITHGKAAIYNKGTLTVEGGTFERSEEAGTYEGNGGNSWYTVYNDYDASLTINGGTFENKGGFSSMLRNQGTLKIIGGKFVSGVNTIKNDDTGVATITGGEFSNETQAVILNWHDLTITGGTFTAGSKAEYAAMNSSWYESEYKEINH